MQGFAVLYITTLPPSLRGLCPSYRLHGQNASLASDVLCQHKNGPAENHGAILISHLWGLEFATNVSETTIDFTFQGAKSKNKSHPN